MSLLSPSLVPRHERKCTFEEHLKRQIQDPRNIEHDFQVCSYPQQKVILTGIKLTMKLITLKLTIKLTLVAI